MVIANDFESMTASVFPSQHSEIIIAKQPVLAAYGREVRSAINQLPPELSRELLAEYKEPSPQLIAKIGDAITSRELAIENASQESNLDQPWLNNANVRRMNEVGLSSEDEWNVPTV